MCQEKGSNEARGESTPQVSQNFGEGNTWKFKTALSQCGHTGPFLWRSKHPTYRTKRRITKKKKRIGWTEMGNSVDKSPNSLKNSTIFPIDRCEHVPIFTKRV